MRRRRSWPGGRPTRARALGPAAVPGSMTHALLLSTYIKFVHLFPEIKHSVEEIFVADSNLRSPGVEMIARLPHTKWSLRTYRLNRTENIQRPTALVMQLIQCVATLSEKMSKGKKGEGKEEPVEEKPEVGLGGEEHEEVIMDHDVLVNKNYENVIGTAFEFLTAFLRKCGSKKGACTAGRSSRTCCRTCCPCSAGCLPPSSPTRGLRSA